MEGYILGGRNIAETTFKRRFKKIYGAKELRTFEKAFRDNFITEDDFRRVSLMGANSVRLPFNYRLLEEKAYSYSKEGFSYLKKAFSWAKKYNLGIILDLHAAAGSQNCDWHADSQGRALLWQRKEYQMRTFALWEALVEEFKDEKSLVGYDLLNEPVLELSGVARLKKFYQELIRRLRAIDKKNLIFLEGNIWAQQIDFLKELIAENICISIHTYQPLNYTFNFTPFYKFPGRIDKILWDKQRIYKYLEPYFKFSSKNKVDIFVGEFGINWRGGFWGEEKWLKAVLSAFEQFGFGYTYWTYKAVARNAFPDGLYQAVDNCKYINREGSLYGWETYLKFWKSEKKDIINFWRTGNFRINKDIVNTLSKFFKKKENK